MYEFIQPNETPHGRYLSSVAMIFDGSLLEEHLDGYQTLTVKGREAISYNLDSSGVIPGRDGEIVTGKSLPPRLLEIRYRLEAETNEEFQFKFRKLNALLEADEEVPIQFRDDPTITYYGQLSEMSEVPEDRNVAVSSFVIYCSDPYKYEDERRVAGNPATLYLLTPYKVHPKEISLHLNSVATKITVDNTTTGRHIILDGDYKPGDNIVIRIEDKIITQNGQNIMNNLDFVDSDFHEYWVKDGDQILVTPRNTDMELTFKRRWK